MVNVLIPLCAQRVCMCVDIRYAAGSTKHSTSLRQTLRKANNQNCCNCMLASCCIVTLAAGILESAAGFSAILHFALLHSCIQHSQVRTLLLQGDAIAGLAAIASANKTRLPEAPLQDSMAARAEQKGLLAMMHHVRLRKRLLIMLAVSAAASQVSLH